MSRDSARPETGHIRKLVQNGFQALAAGDLPAAVECCRDALQLQPELARAHYLAANIALESGDRASAKRALERVVELNPSYAAAWANLALLAVTSGEFVKAEGCLANAINTESGNPAVQDLIGRVFRHAGSLSSAKKWQQMAVSGDDRHVPFLINLANSHRYHGEIEEALQLLTRCLQLQPGHAQAHWILATTRKATDDRHIDEMRSLLQGQLPTRTITYLEYAQARELEDLERWHEAGAALARGASARRTTVQYDEAAEQQMFDSLAENFTSAWLDKNQVTRGTAKDATGPLFIVGEPRTGTTLLDRMLAAHPEISSAGELRHFGFAVRRACHADEPRQFTAGLMQALVHADMRTLGDAYIASTAALYEKRFLIDKLPANYLYLPAILAALPQARVIHLQRQPIDSVFAVYKQLFADAYLYSYDQGEAARHYVRYASLLKVYGQRFPDRFLTLSYEDLVTSPEQTLRAALSFVGVPWDARCLEVGKNGGAIATASAVQVTEALHTRSINRWQRFESQLSAMTSILHDAGLRPS